MLTLRDLGNDMKEQYEVYADSVEDLLNRYYKADRYTGRGEVYAKLLLEGYQNDLRDHGHCFISLHDSVTGKPVTYYGNTGETS